MKLTDEKTTYKYVDISQITDAKYMDKALSFAGQVAHKETVPFMAYDEVKMTCTPDDSKAMCNGCRNAATGFKSKTIGAKSPHILKFMHLNAEKVGGVLKCVAGVPSKCSMSKFDLSGTKTNLTRGSITPMIDDVGTLVNDAENIHEIMVPIVFVGDADMVELNKTYMFSGFLHADPKSGRAMFACEVAKPIADDIRNFRLTDKINEKLKRFQPEERTVSGYKAKIRDILNELKVNHHKINGREDCAFWQVLTFTCPLDYRWGSFGTSGRRGWLETAIIGDTKTGKSIMAEGMMKAFNIGYKISGDSVTYSGLVGGATQDATGMWTINWGLCPRHDRRILIMDEMHNENAIPVLKQLNEMRTSGVAKITKIVQGACPARVRKLILANPPEGTTTESWSFGVELLSSIFTTSESIARLDIFVCPVKSDVDSTESGMIHDAIDPYYQPQLQDLIRYIYSRTGEQMVIHDDVRDIIRKEAVRLCNKYNGLKIPLIESGETHHKIARMCNAVAALTYNVEDGDRDTLVIDEAIIKIVVEAIEANYDNDSTGYLAYSRREDRYAKFNDFKEFYAICSGVRSDFGKAHFELLEMLKDAPEMTSRDISDVWDISPVKLKSLMTILRKNRLFTNKSGKIRKTKRGLHVLRFLVGYGDEPKLIDKSAITEYFKKHMV